jgi:hypothetical protein
MNGLRVVEGLKILFVFKLFMFGIDCLSRFSSFPKETNGFAVVEPEKGPTAKPPIGFTDMPIELPSFVNIAF